MPTGGLRAPGVPGEPRRGTLCAGRVDFWLDISGYYDILIYMATTKTKRRVPLTDLDALADAAECLKTLAHPHRLRMVQMMLAGEYTVGELADACEIPSHMASEHLRMMKDRGLLGSRRDGRRTYYHVEERGLTGIMSCIEGRFGRSRRGD